MQKDELADIIGVALQRGSRAYECPDGALMEILVRYATEGRIESLAEAVSAYGQALPRALPAIRKRIPGILANHLLPASCGGDCRPFMMWSLGNTGWAERIEHCCHNPLLLRTAVEQIVQDVANMQRHGGEFARPTPGN